jgi:hypothetical protein
MSYIVFCGTMKTWWAGILWGLARFRQLIMQLPQLRGLRSAVFEFEDSDSLLISIREARESVPGARKLFNMVCAGRKHDASDPRDHIYAFLGMMGSSFVAAFKPDYEKSVGQVYQDFTHFMISGQSYGHSLDVLEQAGVAATSENTRVDVRKLFNVIDQAISVVEDLSLDDAEFGDFAERMCHILINDLKPQQMVLLKNPAMGHLMRDIFGQQQFSVIMKIMSFNTPESRYAFLECTANEVFEIDKLPTEMEIINEMKQGSQFLSGLISPMKSGPSSALDLIDSKEAFYATPLGTEINDDLAHMSLEKVATLPPQSDGLPSWVPGWNKPVTRASFLKYIPNRPIEDDFAYAASGRDPRPFLQGSTCLFDVRGQELHIRAFRVDVVKQLAPLFFISPSWHSQKDEDAIWTKIQEQVDLNITYE